MEEISDLGTDAREHEDDLELIALDPRFSGRIVRKLVLCRSWTMAHVSGCEAIYDTFSLGVMVIKVSNRGFDPCE